MSSTILMDQLQATVWPLERVVQSACHTDINSPIIKDNTENEVEDDVSRFISIVHESFNASFNRSSG